MVSIVRQKLEVIQRHIQRPLREPQTSGECKLLHVLVKLLVVLPLEFVSIVGGLIFAHALLLLFATAGWLWGNPHAALHDAAVLSLDLATPVILLGTNVGICWDNCFALALDLKREEPEDGVILV